MGNSKLKPRVPHPCLRVFCEDRVGILTLNSRKLQPTVFDFSNTTPQ